jgi:hypothetical protein
MEPSFKLIKPTITPPLDEGFRPAVLANRAYQEMIDESEGVRWYWAWSAKMVSFHAWKPGFCRKIILKPKQTCSMLSGW